MTIIVGTNRAFYRKIGNGHIESLLTFENFRTAPGLRKRIPVVITVSPMLIPLITSILEAVRIPVFTVINFA